MLCEESIDQSRVRRVDVESKHRLAELRGVERVPHGDAAARDGHTGEDAHGLGLGRGPRHERGSDGVFQRLHGVEGGHGARGVIDWERELGRYADVRDDAGSELLESFALGVGECLGAGALRELAANEGSLELGRWRGAMIGAARIVVEEGVRVAPGGGRRRGVRVPAAGVLHVGVERLRLGHGGRARLHRGALGLGAGQRARLVPAKHGSLPGAERGEVHEPVGDGLRTEQRSGATRVVTDVRTRLGDDGEVVGGDVDVELGDRATEIVAQNRARGGVVGGADVALEPSRDAADAVTALLEDLLDQEVLPGRRPGLVGQGHCGGACRIMTI